MAADNRASPVANAISESVDATDVLFTFTVKTDKKKGVSIIIKTLPVEVPLGVYAVVACDRSAACRR